MAAVTARETRHNHRAAFSNSGWACRVPLPPLKGVRVVLASSPLLKSKYSLKALTQMWEVTAPTSTSRTCSHLTVPVCIQAVPTPTATQAGGRSRKGRRMGPRRDLNVFMNDCSSGGLKYAPYFTHNLQINQRNETFRITPGRKDRSPCGTGSATAGCRRCPAGRLPAH